MKVFVATGSRNRQLVGDLHRAIDGEMVWLYRNDEPCAECGCRWAVSGLASGKVAPRFTIAERTDLTDEDYVGLMYDAWIRRGLPLPDGWQERMGRWLATQMALASSFEEGDELSFLRGRLHRTPVA
jgi:hypothetical protein